jgi:phosphotriesterase-related protein
VNAARGGREPRPPGGPVVRTITGDVPAKDLGRTLIHEHLMSDLTVYWSPDLAPDVAHATVGLDTLAETRAHAFSVRDNLVLGDLALAARELGEFRSAGGGAVVDVTSRGIGRDMRAIEWVARTSGVNVVAGCGYYIGSSHPVGLAERSEASLAEEMTLEIQAGVAGTGLRAGVLGELGVGTFPMAAGERRVLRAAARAQRTTGAAMILHSAPGTDSVFEIIRVLDGAGARMDKVVISHLDERFRDDFGVFRRAARSGIRFGFDTFGREIYYDGRRKQHPSDTQRIEVVCRLLDTGFGDRIALAQDICLKHELCAFGGQGYAHLLKRIVPRMLLAGIPQTDIDRMLIDTPAAILALEP